MVYLNCLLITLIVVSVLDVFGFWNEISGNIKKWMTGGKLSEPFELKPFSCSLCSSFWCNLIYIVAINQFSIVMLAYIVGLSYMTPVFKDLLFTVRDFISYIIRLINRIFQ